MKRTLYLHSDAAYDNKYVKIGSGAFYDNEFSSLEFLSGILLTEMIIQLPVSADFESGASLTFFDLIFRLCERVFVVSEHVFNHNLTFCDCDFFNCFAFFAGFSQSFSIKNLFFKIQAIFFVVIF